MYFDDTTGPPPPGLVRGAPARPLIHAKRTPAPSSASPSVAAGSSTPPDPEVLGFAQSGEVSSGSWTSDLRFNLLSTVAYFGVNVNPDGTLITGDAGYSTWWSSQETSLINAAHAAQDRVVLTVKAFNDSLIASVTGSEQARQTLIQSIVNEVLNRPADGVNIDFEGVSSALAANFTTFIAELQNGLVARAAGHSYLTVDTYASAGQGGTMYDLSSLWHHVDALDLMGYGFEPCTSGHAGPSAPMGGCWYNVTQAVSDYMTRFGVPASELLLGVPYYGYKWDVGCAGGCTGQDPTTSGGSADTYAATLSDFSCAQQLQQHWDATFQGPWASWYSPAANDPCGGNHGSFRELYYDNAASLGLKYDLVNSRQLRGIAIWALGYDSGTSDLWNEIAAKFSVTKFPTFHPKGVGAPNLTTAADGTQLVFWSGAGGHLVEGWWHGAWNGPVDWSASNGWTATVGSSPTAAIAPNGTQMVFWQGLGDHVVEAWWNGHWNGPVDWTSANGWPDSVTSAPSVTLAPDGTQLLFWQGPGGHLEEAWWNGHWNGPVDWSQANHWSSPMESSPSVTMAPDGTQIVFWQGVGHLYEAWWNGHWNGPVDWSQANHWSNPLVSSPSVTMAADGTQVVFWQGAGGHLFETWWNGHWNGPVDWTAANGWGSSPLTSAPSVRITSDGTQLIFWQGSGGHLVEAWWNGHWNGPADWSA